MPYFYRKRWWKPRARIYKRFQKRKFRFRYRRRRPRKIIRRRYQWVRRFKKLFKKKRKFLKLGQWQPELIRNSHIKGIFTLFEASPGRFSNNWPQYRDSLYPEWAPGGGGWSILVFNLGALFDEFQRVRNWWTVSNVNLPLCRFINAKFKFYRDENVDYIVHYSTSYPMTDTAQKHADAQPSRMLMRRHKIIVRSKSHNPRAKPYVKKKN